jgi:basic membrane protein A
MYQNGADIVYHAAGGSGGGVFEAAADAGGFAIGVDSDQFETADPSVQDVIITSMLKKVNVGVYEYLTEVAGGTYPSGSVVYDLAADGVGYSTTGDKLSQETIDRLEEFKQQIIDGEIEVPTAP